MRFFSTLALTSALLLPLYAPASVAQSSAAAVLEKARAQSKEFNEFKAALNDPDQNVRLAVFDVMLHNENEALRRIALETGLSSADNLIRTMAFKNLVMGLTQLHINLTPDPQAPKPQQEAATAFIANYGTALVLNLEKKDIEQATFTSSYWIGQVSGLDIKLNNEVEVKSAELTLQEDGALKGKAHLDRGKTPFIATARLL